jgi:hypothetical protein
MKEYKSIITIKFGGNNLECESEEEYRKRIKENFYEQYNIDLRDDEIKIEGKK